MNIYAVTERIHSVEKSTDGKAVFEDFTSFVLGTDVGDAVSQFDEAGRIIGVTEVCRVTELPGSKYRVVPVDEVVGGSFDTPPVHALDELEEVLEGVKNELVREQGYHRAVRVRDALALVHRMRMELRTESPASGSGDSDGHTDLDGALDPEVLGCIHDWCLEQEEGTRFGLSDVPRPDDDRNATILYLYELSRRGVVERDVDDLDVWRVCTE